MSDQPVTVIWCRSCGIHYAQPHIGRCPVCLDDARKEQK